MRANQLRLWFASMGYALLCALRRIGLTHPHLSIRHDAMSSRDVLGRHVHVDGISFGENSDPCVGSQFQVR
jgi:hypothetical protein